MKIFRSVRAVRNANAAGELECPECDCVDTHDDNGERGSRLSFCCVDCGSHFDAEDMVTEPGVYYAGTIAF